MTGWRCSSPPRSRGRCWTCWASRRAAFIWLATRDRQEHGGGGGGERLGQADCGRPANALWRGTANGLEGTAAETADTLLILDEMGQADAREVGDVVYMLANEAGKQRASRTGAARRRQSWRTLFLSTGEITLAQKMGEAGKRATAGLDVRSRRTCRPMPARAWAYFRTFTAGPDAAALRRGIKGYRAVAHGNRVRASSLPEAGTETGRPAQRAARHMDALRDGVSRPACSGRRDRSGPQRGRRFALIACCRRVGARLWGAAVARGRGVASGRRVPVGVAGSSAEARAGGGCCGAGQVRGFLEAHGECRFTLLTRPHEAGTGAPDVTRTINRAGSGGGSAAKRRAMGILILPRRGKPRCARDWTPRGWRICWPYTSCWWAARSATAPPWKRSRRGQAAGLSGVGGDPGGRRCRVRRCACWPANIGSGRPEPLGTRDPGATGSVADASESKDFQEVAGHRTPKTWEPVRVTMFHRKRLTPGV